MNNLSIEELKDVVANAKTSLEQYLALELIAIRELKGDQVPVAQIVISKNWPDIGRKVIDYYLEKIQHLPVGTELFTAPQKPVEDYFSSLVAMGKIAAEKAMRKYPQPNYVLLKVAEEAGEVVQAAVHYAENRMTWVELEGEVIQLIAMLNRLMVEGDQVNGVKPPQAIEAAGGVVKESDKCHPSLMESVTVPHNVIGSYEDASGGRSDIVTLSDKREMKDMSSIMKDGE